MTHPKEALLLRLLRATKTRSDWYRKNGVCEGGSFERDRLHVDLDFDLEAEAILAAWAKLP